MYTPSQPDGINASVNCAISEDGTPIIGKTYTIPPRCGAAVRLKDGDVLSIINVAGHQVCDFFALVAGNSAEFLSMEHTRTSLGHIYVREGDTLVTNRRRAMIEVVEDTSAGVHDIIIACCDQPRYEQLGASGYHDNCADNFRIALSTIGETPTHVPCPFNIWMNIPVATDGTYRWDPPVSKPGDIIKLKAHMDCVVVMSACPQDLTPVNGLNTKPERLDFRVEDKNS